MADEKKVNLESLQSDFAQLSKRILFLKGLSSLSFQAAMNITIGLSGLSNPNGSKPGEITTKLIAGLNGLQENLPKLLVAKFDSGLTTVNLIEMREMFTKFVSDLYNNLNLDPKKSVDFIDKFEENFANSAKVAGTFDVMNSAIATELAKIEAKKVANQPKLYTPQQSCTFYGQAKAAEKVYVDTFGHLTQAGEERLHDLTAKRDDKKISWKESSELSKLEKVDEVTRRDVDNTL